MATGDYTDLATVREYIRRAHRYEAATISFASSTKVIADTRRGLARFGTGAILKITGSTNNNGYFTVATGDTAASLVVSEALTTEAAGATVTIEDVSDTIEDELLTALITAASRAIDAHCGRRFYTTTEDETRYYTALASDYVRTDPIVSLTTLKADEDDDGTYEETWDSADYALEPANAALESRSYLGIRATGRYGEAFPTRAKAIQVVGKFGASAVPSGVEIACAMLVGALYRWRDMPEGTAGPSQMSLRELIQHNPLINGLLAEWVRP